MKTVLATAGISLLNNSRLVADKTEEAVSVWEPEMPVVAVTAIPKDNPLPALNRSISEITGIKDPVAAWASLFDKNDIVGIKVNCLAGARLSTSVFLAEAVAECLINAGVKANNILIWERSDRELKRAGYKINKGETGVRCFGTDALSGGGYEEEPEDSGSIGSCFSRILSKHITALINIPVLKDHDLSGISGGMKNLYGAIHNPNKYHSNNCSPFVADLSNHPYIKNKLKLVICDGTLAQYNGGPAFAEQWAWDFGRIICGTDPVAVDAVCADVIENKRKKEGLLSLKEAKREPVWLRKASELGLGVSDTTKIRIVEL